MDTEEAKAQEGRLKSDKINKLDSASASYDFCYSNGEIGTKDRSDLGLISNG